MSRTWDIAGMIKAGESPPAIAKTLGIALSSVMTYAQRAVGEGLIRRSDIFFSFPPELRQRYQRELKPFSSAPSALGDMYEDIRRIEVSLHTRIRQVLEESHGDGEDGWWRRGIPEQVRIKCQERRERDSDSPCEPYTYTDLLDLGKILENQWTQLRGEMPDRYRANRKQLLSDLARLNRIRNRVMHPVRGLLPSEDDFDFVRGFARVLGVPDPGNVV